MLRFFSKGKEKDQNTHIQVRAPQGAKGKGKGREVSAISQIRHHSVTQSQALESLYKYSKISLAVLR